MKNSEHEEPKLPSWFNEKPHIEEQRMVPVQLRWICPVDGCGGEMKHNGQAWMTYPEGYHHTCDKCRFTAVIRGKKYPAMTHIPGGNLAVLDGLELVEGPSISFELEGGEKEDLPNGVYVVTEVDDDDSME